MLEALLISQVLLWIIVVTLAAAVLALLRQVGVLHERIAPMGALTIDRGPAEGEPAPRFDLAALDGRAVSIGGANPRGRSILLFFLSPTCPVCKQLLPVLKSIVRSEAPRLEAILASDGPHEGHLAFLERENLQDFPYVLSTELGMTYRIGKLPYAIVIDPDGVISAKGLVNTREHLESLMEAARTKVPSIQEYLRRTGRVESGRDGETAEPR